MTSFGPLAWTVFGILVLAMLAVELGGCGAPRWTALRRDPQHLSLSFMAAVLVVTVVWSLRAAAAPDT